MSSTRVGQRHLAEVVEGQCRAGPGPGRRARACGSTRPSSMSDFSLPRSVTMKRLDTSAPCPTSSSVAGSISCIHMPLADHEDEVRRQQRDEHAAGDHERRPGAEPRQQRDQVRGDEQEQQHLDPVRPRRRDEEMLLTGSTTPSARASAPAPSPARPASPEVRAEAGRGRRRSARSCRRTWRPGSCRVQTSKNESTGERGPAVAVLVEIGVHLQAGSVPILQLAERHALAAAAP